MIVNIDNVIHGKDTLYFKTIAYRDDAVFLQKRKKNGYKRNAVAAVMKADLYTGKPARYHHFIYRNDTMTVRLLYLIEREYSTNITNIAIRNLQFIKGQFTIDLDRCVGSIKESDDGRFIIENFPCDCMNFIKKEVTIQVPPSYRGKKNPPPPNRELPHLASHLKIQRHFVHSLQRNIGG
jgi:hypothetical protein